MHITDDLLFQYIDNELAPADRRDVAAHLGTCPDCAARLVEWRALLGDVASVPEVALTADLSAAVVEQLSAETELTTLPAIRWLSVGQLALAAFAIALSWPFLQLIARFDQLLAVTNLQTISTAVAQQAITTWKQLNAPFSSWFALAEAQVGPVTIPTLSLTTSISLIAVASLLVAVATRVALHGLELEHS